MKTGIFGFSVSGLPILFHEWNQGSIHVLILGGVHGDEVEGVFVSQALLGAFLKNFPYSIKLTLIPVFNPDGFLQNTRTNQNLIDLNRNLPTKDWTPNVAKEKYNPGVQPNSEPENQALVSWFEKNSPQFIISIHSWKPLLNVNGNCEPEASVLSQETGYKVVQDIGYPTPGSLGTYSGQERKIPTLTYEVEKGIDFKKALQVHVPAIQKALFESEKRTLN